MRGGAWLARAAALLLLSPAGPGVRGAEARPAEPAVRRLALVAGANDGGARRERLRYAVSDAERVARVLHQLGGVADGDAVVLLDPTEPALRAALAELRARAAQVRGPGRVEVVFYYSGHSDDEGLLVRGQRLPYLELRRWLEGLSADVRVAVIDSCSSGALTRNKGGTPAAPFLVDASTRVRGHAFLTSSAWDEASQESDRIGASFFTAALLTGLRGAADADHDGRVTLSEAYQFSFQETLARTERTRGGPQHPSWDIQLTGAGEVVLTDLRGTAAALSFPAEAAGRFFVRDGGERLVAELRKDAGQPLLLGLDPGVYRVAREQEGQLVEARVEVRPGPATALPATGFAPLAREVTALRGEAPEEVEHRFADLALFPPVSLNGDRPAENHLQLALIGSRTTRLRGVGIGPVLWADEDAWGLYLADVGSAVRGPVRGAQVSGVASLAGRLQGAQASSLGNVVRGDVQGAQAAAAFNWAAGDLLGAQLAAVNLAGGEVVGGQLGLVNSAGRVRGVQLGLVNVADHVDGAPIGLVSWVRDGEHKLLALGGSDGTAAAELLLGSPYVHGLLRVRGQRADGGGRAWVGYGLGTHLQRGMWMADLDGLAEMAPSAPADHVLVTARLLLGWQATPALAVVAGPTASGFWSAEADGRRFDPGLDGALARRLGSGRGWAGFQAGLRLGR